MRIVILVALALFSLGTLFYYLTNHEERTIKQKKIVMFIDADEKNTSLFSTCIEPSLTNCLEDIATNQKGTTFDLEIYPINGNTGTATAIVNYSFNQKRLEDVLSFINEYETDIKNIKRQWNKNKYLLSNTNNITKIFPTIELAANRLSLSSFDETYLIYISDLLECERFGKSDNGEFCFVDNSGGEMTLDDAELNIAANQLNDSLSWISKNILSRSKGKFDKTQIKIYLPQNINIQSKDGMSFSEVKDFWIEFFDKLGSEVQIYDSVEDIKRFEF